MATKAISLESAMNRYGIERNLRQGGNKIIVGVDEVGRGPLAGPVVAAAVALELSIIEDLIERRDLYHPLLKVDDSKKLSEKMRTTLVPIIFENANAWAIKRIEADEIDRINILQATFKAMAAAVYGLGFTPDIVLVDGNMEIPNLPYLQRAVIKGDSLTYSIAAASIIAKDERDRIMRRYDEEFPGYSFAKHKGYGTAEHRRSIIDRGPCRIHRHSFIGSILDKDN